MYKISVITICYNAEKVIERTMLSVLNQTFGNIEYVVLDGGSNDATVDIVKEIISTYPQRNIVFKSEPDDGIYDAMNKAIKMASGEWLSIMNAGDIYTSNDVLERVFQIAIPQSKTVLYSDNYMSLLDGRRVLVSNHLEKRVDSFNHQSIVYKRSLHSEYGYYVHLNKLIISDTLFFASIPDRQKMKIHDVVIADYAEGGASCKAGYSIFKQNLCAEYIYKDSSFFHIFVAYYKRRIKEVLFPKKVRQCIKHLLKKV